MKICIIGNPNSIHTRRWANWFSHRGHNLTIIADVKPESRWKEFADYVLPSWFALPVIKYLVWEITTRRILQKIKPDILHAHRVSSAGWLGVFSEFHPFVVTPWGSDLYQHPHRSRMAARLARYVLRQADLVTASSQNLCEQAVVYGADPQKTHMIGWGVDLRLFRHSEPSRSLVELDIGDAPVVLSIRAVKPIYNLDVMIRSIPLVLETIPNVIFVFQHYNSDSSYKASLDKLIDQLEIGQNVRWLNEPLVWEQVPEVYRLATIAISLASTDSFPISIQEAMASGVPLIAGDLPSLREWITPGENGLLVPIGNTQALAEAIIQLLNDTALQHIFRQRNLELVRQRADQDQEMLRMERLYQQLLRIES